MAKIIYTHTDEAPMLATYSFLPIVEAFASTAGVEVETRDISLAGRIIAVFGDYLTEEQRISDALAELGDLAKKPEANIIKLPNISASMPQLKAAIAELQAQGYALPDYPDNPSSDTETDIRSRYDKIKGSAVNPVLREGNSDRRAPLSVKNYARQNPHSMGAWTPESKTNVATMGADDFRSNEKSVVIEADDTIKIQLVKEDGTVKVLKRGFPVLAGEVVDGTVMRAAALDEFLAAQVARAKEEGVLFSAHLKATMMKVSDPIIFGHVVKAYFAELFDTYGEQLAAAGLSPNNGLASILGGLEDLPEDVREGVKAAIKKGLEDGPALAMVDSDKGITNLHVPSDVIVDASMPAMIRSSGHMWGRGRQGSRHARGPPGQQLRRHLPGCHRRLPRQRRLRPHHHGHRPERGPHGPGRRGIRQPRQDLRDPVRRHGPARGQQRHRPDRTPGGPGRHLARLPDQGRADPRLGQAGRHPRPRLRNPGRVLAGRGARPRRQPDRQGQGIPQGPRHRGPPDRNHVPG